MIDLKIYLDDPDRLKARENTVRLQLRRSEILKKLDAYRAELRPETASGHARAAAMLRGEDIHQVDAAGIRESIAGLHRELYVVTDAIELAKAVEREAEFAASRKQGEASRGVYVALVKKCAQSMFSVMNDLRAELEFRDAFVAGGASFTLATAAMPGINAAEFDRSDCREAYWCRGMVEAGYLAARDCPARYREAWGLDLLEKPKLARVV